MSLAEYRVHDGVDVGLVDPLAERLLRLLTLFGGRVLIISGRRSYAEQQVLWEQYLAGGPLAARPGTSLHERGAAADLRIVDSSVTWREVHLAAGTYGLCFPIPSEDWHVQADPAWVEPEDHDMTPQEMAHLLGCTLDGFGRAVVPVGDKVFPLANVVAFILDEVQRDDLLVQRIKDKLDS
jgi:hypothetical protein